MKKVLFLFLIINTSCCFAQKDALTGTWRNDEDKNSVIKFKSGKFSMVYKDEVFLSASYIRSSQSCDTAYYNDKGNYRKLDFIKLQDGTCYEIVGLTDSVLSYRETKSGRTQFFSRLTK